MMNICCLNSIENIKEDYKKRTEELEKSMQEFVKEYDELEPNEIGFFIDFVIKKSDEFKKLLEK